ncbi:hypothetical protein NM208_g12945 [Fusarium decemcellulare]|uniref:Uncharacterized protein n=1 Tax=Fusarium decemcellulare TaxID=57161 RepID=A0ACC1RMW6_9HYPO|nr:hypothetical protein NM208_g12945 [Fusarium decemcellulare]
MRTLPGIRTPSGKVDNEVAAVEVNEAEVKEEPLGLATGDVAADVPVLYSLHVTVSFFLLAVAAWSSFVRFEASKPSTARDCLTPR